MTGVLTCENVTVRFGSGRPAVSDVSLSLQKGEIFGLVGESGSGKSTLANAVMGLLPDSATVSGTIRMADLALTGLSETEMRCLRGNRIGMIFQDASASLDPTWSVGDQIAEAVRAHKPVSRAAAKARAIGLMEEVGIPDAAARYKDVPHRFSGGMRQRIVIAAALANEPDILIADEPTSALDVTIQAQVLALIDRLRKDHETSVLLITHDLGVVGQVCDRVGVMHGGKLLETGETRAIFANPQHPYTRALMDANPAGKPRGTRLPVIPPEWSVESLLAREEAADG